MEEIGERLTEIGLAIIPYSFALYFPVRLVEHLMRWGYTRLVKAIWYLALGVGYVTADLRVEVIVGYICFIEAWDLLLEQRETLGLRKGREVPPGGVRKASGSS